MSSIHGTRKNTGHFGGINRLRLSKLSLFFLMVPSRISSGDPFLLRIFGIKFISDLMISWIKGIPQGAMKFVEFGFRDLDVRTPESDVYTKSTKKEITWLFPFSYVLNAWITPAQSHNQTHRKCHWNNITICRFYFCLQYTFWVYKIVIDYNLPFGFIMFFTAIHELHVFAFLIQLFC